MWHPNDSVVPLSDGLAAAYLARLGAARDGHPSIAGLTELHRAHAARVVYENLDLVLRRAPGISPQLSAERIVRGRGGYCYHLNGAFSALLATLGYRVVRHRGDVGIAPGSAGVIGGGHLALTVGELPSEEAPSGLWWVDVGLGTGPSDPIPLHSAVHQQGTSRYAVHPSAAEPDGWRIDQTPNDGWRGMDFALAPWSLDDAAPMHAAFASGRVGSFATLPTAQRRHAAGTDVLRAKTLTRVTGSATDRHQLARRAVWFDSLAEIFRLDLAGLDNAARVQLWEAVERSHDEWLATGPTS